MLETIRRILALQKEVIWKHKFYSLFYVGFLVSIIISVEPFFFVKIIDTIEWFYSNQSFVLSELFTYISIWWIFMVFSICCNFIYHYYFADISNLKYYTELFKKYSHINLSIEYGEYLWYKSWELHSIMKRWIQDSFSFLYFFYFEIIRSLSWVILMIIVLIMLNPIMALASLSMIPVLIFIGFFFQQKTYTLQKEINDFDDTNYGELWDASTNLSLVKSLSIEKNIFAWLRNNIDESFTRQALVSKRWWVCQVSTWFLVMLARAITVITGTYLVYIGDISLAYLFLYFSFIGWIYFPLSFVFARMRQIQEQLTSAQKMFKTFDKIATENDLDNWKNIKNPEWNISLNQVSFGYLKNKSVLNNISLDITSGQRVAFVGNTGAGKSTMVNLMLRFWDIEQGSITLDGTDIRDIKKSSLRSHIGVVSQDNSLFNMSIKENLLFAKPKATKKDLENALKQAQAQFVFDLENGIDTVIGERWLKLSGWEKQRLSIARLFLKDPKILILDEATSALDNKTEKLVQKALDTLMKWRTSIIIAHRLSTIQHADVIYMLENGTIVESWDYETLMKNKKKFYNLANPDHLIIN